MPNDFDPITIACLRIFSNKAQFETGKVMRGPSNYVKRWKGETYEERRMREIQEQGAHLNWDSDSS